MRMTFSCDLAGDSDVTFKALESEVDVAQTEVVSSFEHHSVKAPGRWCPVCSPRSFFNIAAPLSIFNGSVQCAFAEWTCSRGDLRITSTETDRDRQRQPHLALRSVVLAPFGFTSNFPWFWASSIATATPSPMSVVTRHTISKCFSSHRFLRGCCFH